MNILFVTEYLGPQKNGIATRCENYIKHLRLLGHSVRVYGPAHCPSSDGKLYTMRNWLNLENSFCFPTIELCAEVMSGKHDVIHLVYPPAFFGFLVLILAWLCGVKVVCSNHVNMERYRESYLSSTFERTVAYAVAKYLIYYPQLVFCQPQHILSPTVSEDLYYAFNFTTGIAPSAVDTELFAPIPIEKVKRKEIIYVGRIAPEKGMMRLLYLSNLVAHMGYTLRVVGPGPDDFVASCHAYVRDHNMKHVTFEGPVAHNKLHSYYASAAVFISCSITETFGFTNLEALSCGCPVVYPRCQAFSELYEADFPEGAFDLDDDNGFITALKAVTANTLSDTDMETNNDDLKDEHEHEHEDNFKRKREKAREFVEKRYTWVNATKKLVEVYQS